MKRVRDACIVTAAVAVIAIITIFAITGNNTKTQSESNRVVVVSPHPIDFMKPLVNEFESQTGISVEVKQYGTSEAISKMLDGEEIDVLWGGSILSVGSYEDSFFPYTTPNSANFIDEYRFENSGITCFSDVPSILIVNTDLCGDMSIEGYEDLLDPALKGRIAYADPSKSSSSFEHLTNMLYAMGGGDPEKGWNYVDKFCEQLDGKLLPSSSSVYQGVASGKFVVGLTFEEAAITMLKSGKHVKLVYMKEGVVSTPDGVYINKNAKNVEQAKSFTDFMTSYDTQQYISMDLGRRSVRKDVPDSSLVSSKEDLELLEVDKDCVVENKNIWVDKFESLYGEDGNE